MLATLSDCSIHQGASRPSALEIALPDARDDGVLFGERDGRGDVRAVRVDPGATGTPPRKHRGVNVESTYVCAQQIGRGRQRSLEYRPIRLEALDASFLEIR